MSPSRPRGQYIRAAPAYLCLLPLLSMSVTPRNVLATFATIIGTEVVLRPRVYHQQPSTFFKSRNRRLKMEMIVPDSNNRRNMTPRLEARSMHDTKGLKISQKGASRYDSIPMFPLGSSPSDGCADAVHHTKIALLCSTHVANIPATSRQQGTRQGTGRERLERSPRGGEQSVALGLARTS
jgi:hypothetical protein